MNNLPKVVTCSGMAGSRVCGITNVDILKHRIIQIFNTTGLL